MGTFCFFLQSLVDASGNATEAEVTVRVGK